MPSLVEGTEEAYPPDPAHECGVRKIFSDNSEPVGSFSSAASVPTFPGGGGGSGTFDIDLDLEDLPSRPNCPFARILAAQTYDTPAELEPETSVKQVKSGKNVKHRGKGKKIGAQALAQATPSTRYHKEDVIAGRGEKAKRQNSRYTSLVRRFYPAYSRTKTPGLKSKMADEIVKIIRSKGGRFLNSKGAELCERAARKKVMKALKDRNKNIPHDR